MTHPDTPGPQRPRSLARQLAFQLLYQQEMNPSGGPGEPSGPRTLAPPDAHRLEEMARQVYQTMCEDEQIEQPASGAGARLQPPWPSSPELVAFIRSLIQGVHRHRSELDARLAEATYHWRVERMTTTDRTILRLAAFEILYTDTPGPVAVDEAIELAKRFGTAQSGPFVNGVLDRVMRDRDTPPGPPPETGHPAPAGSGPPPGPRDR